VNRQILIYPNLPDYFRIFHPAFGVLKTSSGGKELLDVDGLLGESLPKVGSNFALQETSTPC
jgi:hypothetical protein